MARRTMALRKARAADRQKRRAELEHLLARLDRHTLLDTERPLLRAHVEQLLATDADLRRTIAGQQTLVQRQARQLDAAHDAIREAEQDAADLREQLRMYRAVEEHQAATEERARTPQPVRRQTPEPDPTEGAPDICQFACTHSVYLHNEFGCRTLGCPCRAAAHLTASTPEQS